MDDLIYKFLVFLAGFIDSIAGGGGLITLPIFTILLGPNAHAIGTNKTIAIAAALTAFIIYARKGHFRFQIAMPFFVATMVGTFWGSRLAFIIPPTFFRLLIILAGPFLLFLILNRKTFIHQPTEQHFLISKKKLILAGLICGIYDGSFGPGGGTIMLISLVTWARLPLMIALACSKFANVISSTTALTSFAMKKAVHWQIGLHLMAFAFAGALLGSHWTNTKAEKIVRPILVLVVSGLLIKLLYDQFA